MLDIATGSIRGNTGSKVILGGSLNPSLDYNWNFSFDTNAHGYSAGYVFSIRFFLNHWNTGNYYKYVESLQGGRGNVTGLNGHTEVNQLGSGGSSWSNGHIEYSVQLSGGTMNGSSSHLFTVKYDADGAPSWTSGYLLEVTHSGNIGTISIT
jgi:hypothetical protein